MKSQPRGAVSRGGLIALCVIAIGVALLLATGPGERPGGLERLASGEPLRVGYANEEPFGYLDAESGAVTGEAPEIAKAMIARLGGGPSEAVVARFGELIPALKAGRLDVVAAGMYVTPERCGEVIFSEPTYRIGEGLIVRRGNPLALHSYEDIVAHESARIGVMGGAVEHGYAKKLGVPEKRIVVFADYPTALIGLETDRIDALAATELTVTTLLRKAEGKPFERATPFRDPVIDGRPVAGYGAFAFRKQDVALRDAFNRELKKFIGTPEHLELVRPFGFSERTLPGDVTTADLCGGSSE